MADKQIVLREAEMTICQSRKVVISAYSIALIIHMRQR